MKRLSLVSIAVFAFTGPLEATAISLTLVPTSQSVTVGQAVSIELFVSGLERPPSVGAFDVSVSFSSALLSPVEVTFGPLLGNPAASPPEALTVFSLTPGVVEFAEVSLLSPATLNSLQTFSFDLATLSFVALSAGTASVALSTVVISDSFGDKLAVVPEPSTSVPFAIGLFGALVYGCRRSRRDVSRIPLRQFTPTTFGIAFNRSRLRSPSRDLITDQSEPFGMQSKVAAAPVHDEHPHTNHDGSTPQSSGSWQALAVHRLPASLRT